MLPSRNRCLVLRHRPTGPIATDTFAMETRPVAPLADGEALVEVAWLGIDATQRTWLNPESTYVEPVAVGEVMRGAGIGRVVASRHPTLPEGQWVYGTPTRSRSRPSPGSPGISAGGGAPRWRI